MSVFTLVRKLKWGPNNKTFKTALLHYGVSSGILHFIGILKAFLLTIKNIASCKKDKFCLSLFTFWFQKMSENMYSIFSTNDAKNRFYVCRVDRFCEKNILIILKKISLQNEKK